MIGQSAIDTAVDAASFKIGLELSVDSLRVALIKPDEQFFQLLRRECVYRTFNFLYRFQAHGRSP
jgi:hypothetical protein